MQKYLMAAGLAAAAACAQAQTSGNININATVSAVCTIAVNPLAFGAYNPLSGTALDVSTSLAVTCSQGTSATIALAAGSNANAGVRRMAGGGSFLSYNLYQPASNVAGATCAYTTVWGNGTLGTTLTTTAAPDLNARSYTVCGRIPAGQNVPTAEYSDVVAATVTF
jgi:spore coat protein U-like protein